MKGRGFVGNEDKFFFARRALLKAENEEVPAGGVRSTVQSETLRQQLADNLLTLGLYAAETTPAVDVPAKSLNRLLMSLSRRDDSVQALNSILTANPKRNATRLLPWIG